MSKCLESKSLGFLSPQNWIYHDSIVDKVIEGNYDDITPYTAEFVVTLNCPNRCGGCSIDESIKNGGCGYAQAKEEKGVWQKNNFMRDDCHLQSTELGKLILNKLKEGGIKGITYTGGGEPFMYPYLEDLVYYTSSIGLDSVVYTAGNAVSPSRIKKMYESSPNLIRMSFNAGTPDVFNSQHNPFNKENGYNHILNSLDTFAKLAHNYPDTDFAVAVLISEKNYHDLENIALRILETNDKYPGGIKFISIRPEFNYQGSFQPSLAISDQAWIDIEEKFRPILIDTGIRVDNIKCRYDALSLKKREYDICRATGLYAEVAPDGKMYHCCEKNCHEGWDIGDLKTQTVKEIYSSQRRFEIADDIENYLNCNKSERSCPIVCKPHETNKQFECIEELREIGALHLAIEWINKHRLPSPPRFVNF